MTPVGYVACSAQSGSSSPSPLCLESFRPPAAGRSPCQLHLQQQQQQQRLLSHRLHALSPPPMTTAAVAGSDHSSSSSSSTSSRHGLVPRSYGALQQLADADRQRRDSGVLIEDVEPGDSDTPTTATSILPMPELVVERIGRIASAAR